MNWTNTFAFNSSLKPIEVFFFFNKHKSQRQRMGEEEAAATSEAGKYMDE